MTDSSDQSAAHKRTQRRHEITAAAKQVFAEQGFHKASISDIIERAGIARGTFYLYFSSKDTVFDSILDEAIDELRERIQRVDTSAGARPPREQLDENVTRVLGFVLADRARIQITPNHGLSPAPAPACRLDGLCRPGPAPIRSSLEFGIDVGIVRPCEIDLVATAILGAIRGVVRHLISLDEPPALEHVAKELLDFALRGVLA